VHGLVWPLMKTSSGTKFGKTEAGTIWLDPQRTSPFKFYQFWVNTDDRDVEGYLKCFTYLSQPKIGEIIREFPPDEDARYRQRILAKEVTELVHGKEHAERAIKASELLFTEFITGIPVEDVLSIFEDVPSTELQATELNSSGIGVVDLIARVGLAPSKSEARRLVQAGGVYVNNRRITDPQTKITREMAIGGRVFVLRKGQKQNHLARLG
jgi:tyrosyl-tRNA synthetase